MNEQTFFAIASPSTLASFIVDIMEFGTGADEQQLKLERKARAVLIANVGEEEAERLISSFVTC